MPGRRSPSEGLMRELGYDRYAAGGSDFGAGVATYMALEDPSPLMLDQLA